MNADRDQLFEAKARTNRSPRSALESIWGYVDRSGDPAIERVRRQMNEWFARYPPALRGNLRSGMSSGLDYQFHAAWFELYLHEMFLKMGWGVGVEPAIEGTSKRPDFLVSHGNHSLLVEATIVGGNDDPLEKRLKAIEDGVDRIRSRDFDLIFEIDTHGAETPSMRRVRRKVNAWLEQLEWSLVRAQEQSEYNEWPCLEVTDGSWTFSFLALARRANRRGKDERAVKIGPARSGVYDYVPTLKDRLKGKARQCAAFGGPVLLAIRMDGMFADSKDVEWALFGRTIARVVKCAGFRSPINIDRRTDGFFRRSDGTWRNQEIFGVLVWGSELRPWAVDTGRPVLWRNPGSTVSDIEVPWDIATYREGELSVSRGPFEPARIFI